MDGSAVMLARVTPFIAASVTVTLPASWRIGGEQPGAPAVPAATLAEPPLLSVKLKTVPGATSSPAILQISMKPLPGVAVTVGVGLRTISVGATVAVFVGVAVAVAVKLGVGEAAAIP